MFWTEEGITDRIEELRRNDAQISDLRARQKVLVNDLDKANVAQRDGARSMVEWLQSRLDMSRRNAAELLYAARWFKRHRPIERRLSEGLVSYDRAFAVLRLAVAGADDSVVEHSYRLDQNQLTQLAARQRRVATVDERRAVEERHFWVQPTLDESTWTLSGRLSGVDGRVLEKALGERAEQLRALPYGDASNRGQRQADALVAMAQDSLDRSGDTATNAATPSVAVFLDLDAANGSGGELGAEVEYGPPVGPAALEELLCTGSVQVIGLADGRPVVTSDAAKAIPPAVRRTVAWRDGGCTIDGCQSRYRLQPHHIRERRHGGSHDPDNLATLCWYRHHVAIHGQGFRIDPDSPPQRRRLIRPRAGPDPP
jgi:hypothetical protein